MLPGPTRLMLGRAGPIEQDLRCAMRLLHQPGSEMQMDDSRPPPEAALSFQPTQDSFDWSEVQGAPVSNPTAAVCIMAGEPLILTLQGKLKRRRAYFNRRTGYRRSLVPGTT